ncbi:unnamed protein product [Closterium sp. NIES-53]
MTKETSLRVRDTWGGRGNGTPRGGEGRHERPWPLRRRSSAAAATAAEGTAAAATAGSTATGVAAAAEKAAAGETAAATAGRSTAAAAAAADDAAGIAAAGKGGRGVAAVKPGVIKRLEACGRGMVGLTTRRAGMGTMMANIRAGGGDSQGDHHQGSQLHRHQTNLREWGHQDHHHHHHHHHRHYPDCHLCPLHDPLRHRCDHPGCAATWH